MEDGERKSSNPMDEEVVSSTQPENVPIPDAVSHDADKNTPKRLNVFLLVICALALVAGVVFYALMIAKNDTTQQSSATSQTKTDGANKEIELTGDLALIASPKTGETWLKEKVKIDPLDILKEGDYTDRVFYKIGQRNGSDIVVMQTAIVGVGLDFFERSSNGVITLMLGYDKNQEHTAEDSYKSTVKIDKTTHYDSLSYPLELTLSDGKKLTRPEYSWNGIFWDSTTSSNDSYSADRKTIKSYGDNKLIKTVRTYKNADMQSVSYSFETPLGNDVRLLYEPVSADVLKKVVWNRGDKQVNDEISSITKGCDLSHGVTIATNVKQNDLFEAGKTSDGQVFYEPGLADSVFVSYYKDYKGVHDPMDDFKTEQQLIDSHGFVYFKDTDGQFLAYNRNTYYVVDGCGKPVVYLYPTKTTNVSVKVGAQVVVSEPEYSSTTGWKVLANPDGSLVVDGKKYDSLYWEGYGYGMYPSILYGNIVTRNEAPARMRSDLEDFGLNSKEIADFMAFWESKLPDNPYVRLTWFTNEQLEALAPLRVTPTPNTTMRIFLDFEGMDQSKFMLPQLFSPIARSGFTVVEWGGLLAGKLQ